MISDDTKSKIGNAATATKTAATSVMHDGQVAAQDLADSVKDQASAAATMVRDKAGDIASDVKAKAMDAAEVARDAVGQTATAAKDSLADGGHKLADSLRTAASDRGPSVQARVLDAVAGGVDTVADTLHGRSFGDLIADVQDLARRNPGLFVAGAAVAGFALARFIRAGSQHDLAMHRRQS